MWHHRSKDAKCSCNFRNGISHLCGTHYMPCLNSSNPYSSCHQQYSYCSHKTHKITENKWYRSGQFYDAKVQWHHQPLPFVIPWFLACQCIYFSRNYRGLMHTLVTIFHNLLFIPNQLHYERDCIRSFYETVEELSFSLLYAIQSVSYLPRIIFIMYPFQLSYM